MTTQPRFKSLGVETKGRPTALIEDTKTGEHHRIYKRGRSYLLRSNDREVLEPGLRNAAREALGGAMVS
jgi:hypothetical protein